MAYTSGSPTGGQLEIGIALVLKDRFSNQAREASSSIRKLHQDAKMAVTANLQAAQGIADSVGSRARVVASGITEAIMQGATFVDTMTTVKAITQATDAQMAVLANTAQSLGMKTMFDSREIASGMQYLAMAGNTAEEINQMIEGAAYVAGATNMALGGKGGAADLITNVMSTFKVEASGAAQVGDQLAKAALSSNMSMIDLAEAIKYAGADMVNLNRTLPEVAALAGVLGNAGIQGSMAGTAMSNMARYLNKSLVQPSYKGGKALKTLGLSIKDFTDSNGDLVDLSTAISKIVAGMQGLTSMEVSQVFNDIFGVRGNRSAAALARSLPEYNELLDKILYQSAGYSKSIVEQRMATIAGGIDKMKSALENLHTTFTTAIEPVILPIFNQIAKVFDFVRKVFAVPVLGTILSSVVTIGTMATIATAGIIKLGTFWLKLTGDSQVSARNMFTLLTAGWRRAKIEAQTYMAMEKAIIAQRKMGMGASIPNIAEATVGGGYLYNGKYVAKQRSDGRWIANTGKGATGWTLVRGKDVVAQTAGSMTSTVMSTAGKRAAAGAAAGAARVAIGRGLLGFGARLVGLLGGPIGIGITALSIIGPMIYDAVKGNKDSTDANTEATNNLNTQYKNLVEADSRNKYPGEDKILIQMYNAMQYWAEQIKNIKPTAVINLNVDGKQKMQETVEDMQGETNFTFGLK